MKRVEQFLFRRVELWVVLLLVPLFMIVLVGFGALVRNAALDGDDVGIAARGAYAIASVPSELVKLIEFEDPHSVSANMSLKRDRNAAAKAHDRFPGRSGFEFHYEKSAAAVTEFLLLSRYDGDTRQNVVELYDLDGQAFVYAWPLDESRIRTGPVDTPFVTFPNDKNTILHPNHPMAEANGSLVFHAADSPIYSVGVCGDVEWQNTDFAYHHSLEKDADGNYWVPGIQQTSLPGFDPTFKDDHIVKLSPSGEVIYSKSVTEILIENDLVNRMYGYDRYIRDPIHLNDIEPVHSDTEYWKKGDVFLSLGHLNMVMLFRPESGEVVWFSQELIMHQHDVDIVGDGKISVFNNNRSTRADGDVVLGLNDLVLYDLADDSHTTHFDAAMQRHEVRTLNQGLHDFSGTDRVMIDETNYGRVLMTDAAGDVYWEYVNRASDGKLYTTNWARLVAGDDGRRIAAAVADAACP